MAYNGFLPENVINIGKIYSIHYFEYMSDFSFEGESHDFWEFICVDKGPAVIRSLFFTKVKLLFMNLMNFIMLQLLERLHRI